jgi:hypothetical protein
LSLALLLWCWWEVTCPSWLCLQRPSPAVWRRWRLHHIYIHRVLDRSLWACPCTPQRLLPTTGTVCGECNSCRWHDPRELGPMSIGLLRNLFSSNIWNGNMEWNMVYS